MKILFDNWQLFIGAFGTLAAWFGGQKMKSIEEKKANSDAVTSMQGVYDNFVKDVETKYNEMRDEMKEVRIQVIELRKENTELRKQLSFWENKYNSLRKEFDKLTK